MITFKDYPYWSAETLEEVRTQLRQITNIRKDDITQIWNISSQFIMGRKVGRIPTSSANVIDGDRVGDVNWTTSFFYILVDNAGTATWRRVALSSW